MAFFFFSNHQAGTSEGITGDGMVSCGVAFHLKVTGSRWAASTPASRSAAFTPLTSVARYGPMVLATSRNGLAALYLLGAVNFSIFSRSEERRVGKERRFSCCSYS